jgi:hypothetical protein
VCRSTSVSLEPRKSPPLRSRTHFPTSSGGNIAIVA